jgi:hypothetical protein
MNLKLAAASCKRTSLEINERKESCLTIVLCWRRIGTEFNRINNFNIYREKESNNYLDRNAPFRPPFNHSSIRCDTGYDAPPLRKASEKSLFLPIHDDLRRV